ncbi:MAG: VWA domain-containing protein [Polyangiaceae bacterium]|nr:VWA domain-containing protein [Polyangiaceae bacterium]
MTPRKPPPPARSPRPRTLQRILLVVLALIAALGAGLAYPAIARGPELVSASWQNWWLLPLLVLVPVVFWRATWGEDRRIPRLRIGTLAPFTVGPVGWHVWLRDMPGVFRSVGFGLFVLALARPINTLRPETSNEKGIDIVLVLDLSGSMQAVIDNVPENLTKFMPRDRDRRIRPTRLDVAKAVIRDFIARRKTDRIGVVVFGKEAYVLSPPTLDYHLLDALVSKMELKLIDGSATAIGDATGVAAARLRRSQAQSKAIMLLTDGDNNAGQIAPEYAAHLAKLVGAKLFTIQIGSGETAEVQDGFDLFGQPRYVTVPFPVNPELLKKLAEETGGETYVASDAAKLQESFHDVLDKLEKTRFEASIASFEDMYRFLLLPGVLLIALDAILRALVLRRFP